jgi:hypothetical protein
MKPIFNYIGKEQLEKCRGIFTSSGWLDNGKYYKQLGLLKEGNYQKIVSRNTQKRVIKLNSRKKYSTNEQKQHLILLEGKEFDKLLKARLNSYDQLLYNMVCAVVIKRSDKCFPFLHISVSYLNLNFTSK